MELRPLLLIALLVCGAAPPSLVGGKSGALRGASAQIANAGGAFAVKCVAMRARAARGSRRTEAKPFGWQHHIRLVLCGGAHCQQFCMLAPGGAARRALPRIEKHCARVCSSALLLRRCRPATLQLTHAWRIAARGSSSAFPFPASTSGSFSRPSGSSSRRVPCAR